MEKQLPSEFNEILSKLQEKEKSQAKKAWMVVMIPALAGIAFMAVSAYYVYLKRQELTRLKWEVAQVEATLEEKIALRDARIRQQHEEYTILAETGAEVQLVDTAIGVKNQSPVTNSTNQDDSPVSTPDQEIKVVNRPKMIIPETYVAQNPVSKIQIKPINLKPTMSDSIVAKKEELMGYKAILRKDYKAAISHFNSAEKAITSYNNAYELSRYLNSVIANNSPHQEVVNTVADKYMWNAPRIAIMEFNKELRDDTRKERLNVIQQKMK